jgi:glyoxylase-like metal-dependent hydrolase (beta-lactamase superfamily II)
VIDPGTDPYTIDEVATYKGFGIASPITHIIHTHNHFDHAGATKDYLKKWQPKVLAYSVNEYVSEKITDKMELDLGYDKAIMHHTPGHTVDSTSIYLKNEKALFTGDTPINIRTKLGSYHTSFIGVLELYLSLDIKTIYSGHDEPQTEHIYEMLENSLKNVRQSQLFT